MLARVYAMAVSSVCASVLSIWPLAGVYCARTLLGRRICKRVDVYMITLSCTWRIYALSERLLVTSCVPSVLWRCACLRTCVCKYSLISFIVYCQVPVLDWLGSSSKDRTSGSRWHWTLRHRQWEPWVAQWTDHRYSHCVVVVLIQQYDCLDVRPSL